MLLLEIPRSGKFISSVGKPISSQTTLFYFSFCICLVSVNVFSIHVVVSIGISISRYFRIDTEKSQTKNL
jgi:hypothetical protein